MIKQHIEQTINNIRSEKEQAIRIAEQRAIQEKIMPYNADIDEKRDKAVQQLTTEFNANVKALQEDFDKKKNEIIVSCEEDKKKNQQTVIATETALISMEYDKTISTLTAALNSVNE